MEIEGIWGLVIIGGPVLLGLAIAYGLIRAKRTTPAEEVRRDEATQDLYEHSPSSEPHSRA